MQLVSLVIVAMIGEAVWETLKMVWEKGKLCVDRIGALVVGIILALSTGLDIISLVGIPIKFPYVGNVLTGIVISRGSNFVHDLMDSIGAAKNPKVLIDSTIKKVDKQTKDE